MKLNISVIGAGIGGIASAIRLAVRGHQVTVFEQAEGPGGKIGQIKWEGYRWDAGPTLFTLPELVEELYIIADEEMKMSIRYTQLEIITRYFYEGGTVINAYSDPKEFAEEVRAKTGEKPERVLRFLNRARTMYELTRDVFIFGSLYSFRTYLTAKFFRTLFQAYRLGMFSTMHGANSRRFKSMQMVQLFDRYATYTGSNPYKAPGTLNLIAHLEHNLGAYFPEKGMHILAEELCKLAMRLGVKFEFNTRVEQIIHHNKIIRGVQINGETRKSDLVISDTDIYFLYKDLLPDVSFPNKYFEQDRSTSAMIFYWAMDRTFKDLELHNLFFSGDYREEFRHLFDLKTISEDPTVYLFVSSKVVKRDAPENCENWFVMINVPENTGQNWDLLVQAARENIITKIERILGTAIRQHIQHEEVRDPRDIEAQTLSYHGSLYGNSSHGLLSPLRRHPNYRKDFHGLYFVGGSVHPGGGIPLCLASASIVDRLIIKHYY